MQVHVMKDDEIMADSRSCCKRANANLLKQEVAGMKLCIERQPSDLSLADRI